MRIRKGIVALVGAGMLTAGIGGVSYGQVVDNDNDQTSTNTNACPGGPGAGGGAGGAAFGALSAGGDGGRGGNGGRTNCRIRSSQRASQNTRISFRNR